MGEQILPSLAEYNAWANARLIEIARTLSPEQVERRMGTGYGSIRDDFAHLWGAQMTWMRRWRGAPTGALPDPGGVTFAQLAQMVIDQDDDLRRFIGGLSPEALQGSI